MITIEKGDPPNFIPIVRVAGLGCHKKGKCRVSRPLHRGCHALAQTHNPLKSLAQQLGTLSVALRSD